MASNLRRAAEALMKEIDGGFQPSEKTIERMRQALAPSPVTKNQQTLLEALKKFGPCKLSDLDLPTMNQKVLRSTARTLIESHRIFIVSSTVGMREPSRVLAYGPRPKGLKRTINGKGATINHASKVAVRRADMMAKGEPVEVQPRRDLAPSWF